MTARTPAIVAALLTAVVVSSSHAVTPGRLVVEPPTLHCAGFHWEITEDHNGNASAKIGFRKIGEGQWRKGMDFMRVSVDGREYVAGSLFNLDPGTTYQARLKLADPDGVEGEAVQTVSFTTRCEPSTPEGGTTYHVYPPGFVGRKAQPLLGEGGDWRATLAGGDDSPLRPGDIVAMHAGTYRLVPEVDSAQTRPVAEVSTRPAPSLPQGGTTWHVYPVDYEGRKEEPLIKLNHYNTPILNRDRSGEKIVKPGDAVLFHGGTYKVDKHNYRDRLFQGPKWGVWWFWGGGEPGKPILFKAAGDGDVVFDGNGQYAIFQLAATDHLWLDGLTFRNAHCGIIAGQAGMGGCQGLTITGCTFSDIAMPVYADTETKDWHLSGNEGLDVVHAGPWYRAFGTIDVRVDGEAGRPVVVQPAGDGDVVIDGGDNYAIFDTTHADHLWIKDLTLRNTECAVLCGLYPFGQAPDGLTVTGCRAEDIRMGVYGDESTGQGWYIADNTFIGRGVGNMSMNQHVSPFGINVCGQGHVVTHNHLEWFQDGIDLGWWDRDTHYDRDDFTASVDVDHNYVFGSGDNSVEADGSYFNGRFIQNAFITDNSASTQSTPGGPYYFIRNLFYNTRADSTFKLPSNIIALHNAFAGAHNQAAFSANEHRFLNNLFVPAPTKVRRGKIPIVSNRKPQPGALSDYNGFRLVPEVMQDQPFVFEQQRQFATLAEYAKASGMETHSILVPGYEKLFVNVPEPREDELYRLEGLDFRLKPGTPAIDAGTFIPNINEHYTGETPDLGPLELGQPMPHYRPREKTCKQGES